MKYPLSQLIAPLMATALTMFVSSAFAGNAASLKIQKDFSMACAEAFKISHPDDTQGLGGKICECAGPESKSQGATDAVIKSETASIRKDPKHEVTDKHVLDAMKYCAIETLQALD
ncbi:MAG: hypothetical protein H7222_09695 [Methylotenera sp.]|nr:hypothetical protein [Oligoflexia bacterium]